MDAQCFKDLNSAVMGIKYAGHLETGVAAAVAAIGKVQHDASYLEGMAGMKEEEFLTAVYAAKEAVYQVQLLFNSQVEPNARLRYNHAVMELPSA